MCVLLFTDFIQEAKNSERAARYFRNNKIVRIPGVFWVCSLLVPTTYLCIVSNYRLDPFLFVQWSCKHIRINLIFFIMPMRYEFDRLFTGFDNKPGFNNAVLQWTQGMACLLLAIYKILQLYLYLHFLLIICEPCYLYYVCFPPMA